MIHLLIRAILVAFAFWGVAVGQGLSVPVFSDTSKALPAPVSVWTGEGAQQTALGSYATFGGASVAHTGEVCFVGTPPVGELATFRVAPDPPVLEQPYISFYAKASKPCTARVSFLYFDTKARASNAVPVTLTTEWNEHRLALSNFLNASYELPRVQWFRISTDLAGVDVYIDDVWNLTPAAAEPEPEPEPEPEQEAPAIDITSFQASVPVTVTITFADGSSVTREARVSVDWRNEQER